MIGSQEIRLGGYAIMLTFYCTACRKISYERRDYESVDKRPYLRYVPKNYVKNNSCSKGFNLKTNSLLGINRNGMLLNSTFYNGI